MADGREYFNGTDDSRHLARKGVQGTKEIPHYLSMTKRGQIKIGNFTMHVRRVAFA
jgi:hypothetical protein